MTSQQGIMVMVGHQDFVMFKNWPEKWIALLKYCMAIDFDLSITVGT